MSHYIIVRSILMSIGRAELTAKLRRACDYPYELNGSSGLWRITVESEEACTRLERSIERFTGVEVVAIDTPYDGIEADHRLGKVCTLDTN